MDEKDILSAIEEGTKTMKADFQKAREEDQKGFDTKVEAILKNLEIKSAKEMQKEISELAEKRAKEASEKLIETASKEMQKNFDEFAAKYKAGSKSENQIKSFRHGMAETLKENHEVIKSLSGSDNKVFQLKDMGFEDFTGYGTFTRDVKNQVIPTKEEAFHMRQILGAGSTTGDTLYYPKATGKTGDGPAPWDYDKADVTDTAAKPDFEMTFDNVTAPVRWIAGILRIPKQMLDDLSWLTSYLTMYAPLELLKAEDQQLLNGTGVGLQISGINTNATAYSTNDATYTGIERIIDAAFAQMATTNQDTPTDVLLNPVDVVKIILNKSAGSGEFNLPPGSVGVVNGRLQIAGLNVQKTNKIAADNFLVGDFARGASLVTRQAPQMRMFEQDRDNVQKNMVTFRIEERIALPIFYDDAFVKGTLFGT